MNDHILNMLKADLTVLDKLEIKPNFADLARKYKMDYRTVKKYYEGYKGKPKNRNCRSKLDPYASVIEKSFLSEEFLTREYTEYFFPNTEKRSEILS